jgi:hypothetical protein
MIISFKHHLKSLEKILNKENIGYNSDRWPTDHFQEGLNKFG